MKQDLHTHTTFCDGKNSPEEMVLAAIEKGLERIGICAHSFTAFDSSYCLPKERYKEFQREISRLKEKYKDSIEVLCGVEQDIFSDADTKGFDYVIGSVHYIKVGGAYLPVDEAPEILENGCKKYFDGDFLSLAECYFKTVSYVAEKTGCNIIGHLDLVSKFNGDGRFFDENDPRYIAAYRAAADELIKFKIPFELNTGGISRGWRSVPYPAPQISDYIAQKGGKLIFSSDAHSTDTIAFGL